MTASSAFPLLGKPTGRWSRQQVVDALAPLVVPTTELFGAERLAFGSKFPIDKSIADLPELVGGLIVLGGQRRRVRPAHQGGR
jgi:predicted TIM-barrel fold metal-dependent hydrolase